LLTEFGDTDPSCPRIWAAIYESSGREGPSGAGGYPTSWPANEDLLPDRVLAERISYADFLVLISSSGGPDSFRIADHPSTEEPVVLE
jgi:hypothetical protein